MDATPFDSNAHTTLNDNMVFSRKHNYRKGMNEGWKRNILSTLGSYARGHHGLAVLMGDHTGGSYLIGWWMKYRPYFR
jgi:hypothetical protein